MLLIDGLGLGVNWQRFLSETLNPVVAPPPPPPPPPKQDGPSAGPTNPSVAPPIPVTATPSTDPSKPTNAEIASATSLVQSMAAQYTVPPPDITVENDKTRAVQKAMQDAQTQYDNASQSLQGAQNVLRLTNRDPESTPDDRKTAQDAYAKARTAADSAQRDLNVTTDAGYMILYGEQANADMPAGMKIDDTGKVTDPGDAQHAADQQFKALLAAFPDHANDPNWVPQPGDCKNPLQTRLYDDWQTASATAAVGASKYYADVANSNLAYTQFQSYLADPDYKSALDAGVGRLNDALQPLELQVTMPDAPASQDAAQQAVTAAAKDANYANAAAGAANDSLALTTAQQRYDAASGKEGPTVIVPNAVSDAKTTLARAQTAANTSGSYLQMLSAQQQVDTLQADYTKKTQAADAWHKANPNSTLKDPQVDLDVGDAYAKLTQAQQQAGIAHDGFVATYGATLAQQYDDQASQIQAQVNARSIFTKPTAQSPFLAPPLSTANGLPAQPAPSLSTAATATPTATPTLPTASPLPAPSLSTANGGLPQSLTTPFALPQSTATPAAPTGPTMLDAKRLQVVAGAIRAADSRLSDSVNERATQAALSQARIQQTGAKSTLASVQQQYDDWAAANPPPVRFRTVAGDDMIPAPSTPRPNLYQDQLDKAKAAVTQADNAVQRLQLLGETSHQQVLMDQFDAGLDERLRNAAPDSDAGSDYGKALHDFYEAHRGELSNSLLDAASASTQNGNTIAFGKLTDNEQRNLIGVALGMQPDVQSPASASDGSDPVSPTRDDVARFTDKDKLKTINTVRDTLLSAGGGANTQVSVLPMVYAAKDAGMTTSAIFKVTGKDGTQYVDETGSTYNDINDYINNNELSKDGTVDIATGHNADGTLQLVSKAAHHESGFDSFLGALTSTGANIGMMLGGMALEGLGGLLDGTGIGAIVGVPLNVLGATMMYTAIGSTMTSAGLDIATRIEHGRSINPFTDAGARSDFINLVPMGAAGAAKLAGSKLFTRAVTALTRTPKVASLLTTGAKATALVTGVGGAVEAFGEAGVDYFTGNKKAAGEELKAGLTNVALMAAGGLKERAVTSQRIRSGRPVPIRTADGQTVTVDSKLLGQILNKGDASSLAYGRTRATLDGDAVKVSPEGMLMVGDKILTYDNKPIRVLDKVSSKQMPPGETVVLGEDGTLSVVKASPKAWTNGTRVDDVTGTGERLSFGPDGEMSTTPNIVAKTKLALLDHEIAQTRDAIRQANDTEAQGPRSLEQTAAEGETASTASNARSTQRTSQERARVDQQHDETEVNRTAAARSDRRSADAQALRARTAELDEPAGAGTRTKADGAPPRVTVKVIDLTDEAPATRPATRDPAGIAVPRGPGAEPMEVGDRTVYVVRDGAAKEAPGARPAALRPQDLEEPVIVVAGEHDAALAPELANRWQKPVYAAAPDAFGADGQLHAGARVLRFDPAPEAMAAEPGVPGAAAAAAEETPPAPPRPAAADDTVIVLAGKRGPNEPALPRPAATAEPVSALDGIFSAPNRVLVLVKPERPATVERTAEHDTGTEGAPAGKAADAGADGKTARTNATGERPSAANDDIGLAAAHPEMTETPPPDLAAPNPGWITRMQMRFGGAALPEAAQALAMQSGTLATQLRMLQDAGWRVTLGKRGGGSRIDPRKRRVTIDGALQHPGSITYTLAHEARHAVEAMAGVLNLDYRNRSGFTRKALEAEARAQINAFEARYEIQLAGGGDIAAHVRLPDAIEHEGNVWRAPSHDYAGTVGRLVDAFADAPVSGRNGETYREFYNDVWARQKRRGGIPRRMPAPQMRETGDAPRGVRSFDERVAWSQAHAEYASPFGDGPVPAIADLQAARSRHFTVMQDEGVLMLHADTLPDGTLLAGGRPVGVHEYALDQAPAFIIQDGYSIVLSAKHGGDAAAAQLANLWQRPVYAPPGRAVGEHAALLDTGTFRRFDPAPAAPHDLGPLTADAEGVHVEGHPARRIDVDRHVGELLGSGGEKTVFALGHDAALAVYDKGPHTSEGGQLDAAIDESIALDDLASYGLQTLTMSGPFSALNRVAVLYRPLGVFHSFGFETGALPRVVSRAALEHIRQIREVVERTGIGFDLQGLFTRRGDFLLSDPGPIGMGAGEHFTALQRLSVIERALTQGLERGNIELAHPELAETPAPDAFVQKPSIITRVRMRFGGAPLPKEAYALVDRSTLLSGQVALAHDAGWTVVVGRPGRGSRIDTAKQRIVLDGRLRGTGTLVYALAHEAQHAVETITRQLALDHASPDALTESALMAEARAQANAFAVRRELIDDAGIDIAKGAHLPDAIAREADRVMPGDEAGLRRLAAAFGDAAPSVPGHATYRDYYASQAAHIQAGGVPREMPAPAPLSRRNAPVPARAARQAAKRTQRALDQLASHGKRDLVRIDGDQLPTVADMKAAFGNDAHVLIAPHIDRPADRIDARHPQPEFIASMRTGANGKFIDKKPASDNLDPKVAQDAFHPLKSKGDANRKDYDYYVSPVPLDELLAFGGAARIEAYFGEQRQWDVEPSATGAADAVVATMKQLDDAPRFQRPKQAAKHASKQAGTDKTVYAIDRKTGKVLGYATLDAAQKWTYVETTSLGDATIADRELADAFRRRSRLLPDGRRGVRFVVADVAHDVVDSYGGFAPAKMRRALDDRKTPLSKPDATVQRVLGQVRPSLRQKNREAADAATPNLLPANADTALDFNAQHAPQLIRALEMGEIPDGRFVYVYDHEGSVTDALRGTLTGIVAVENGTVRWYDDAAQFHDGTNEGLPLERATIGRGPFGGNQHFLLSTLAPDAFVPRATALKEAALQAEEAARQAAAAAAAAAAPPAAGKGAKGGKSNNGGNGVQAGKPGRKRMRGKPPSKQPKQPAAQPAKPPAVPAAKPIALEPYQPAFVSSTIVESVTRYGKAKVGDFASTLERLKEWGKRDQGKHDGDGLTFSDTPQAIMADAALWKKIFKTLDMWREASSLHPHGFLANPGGGRNRLVRRSQQFAIDHGAARTTDRKLIDAYVELPADIRDRLVPMSRSFSLRDDPEQMRQTIEQYGGALTAVALQVDPYSQAAAVGGKQDPGLIRRARQFGDPTGARYDDDTATITRTDPDGTQRTLELDDLAHLHKWLTAASKYGFLLRLEAAPARPLVSLEDGHAMAGTNNGYAEIRRIGESLETWAKQNEGEKAPLVMLTFHGADAVLEPVPGEGHVQLLDEILGREQLDWVHVGLSWGTHGDDFIANADLTRALAQKIVEYKLDGSGKFDRLHGGDALTRVYEPNSTEDFANQQRILFTEIERIAKKNGMTDDQIAALRDQLYERNTSTLLNQARRATNEYGQSMWRRKGDKGIGTREKKAREVGRDWLKRNRDSTAERPELAQTPASDARLHWKAVTSRKALQNDGSHPIGANRKAIAQPDQPAATMDEATAHLNALRVHRHSKDPSDRRKTKITGGIVLGASSLIGLDAKFHWMSPVLMSNMSSSFLLASRLGRVFQVMHQGAIRSLQSGDPKAAIAALSHLEATLARQLGSDTHEYGEHRPLQLDAAVRDAQAMTMQYVEQYKRGTMSFDDAKANITALADDVLTQMQGFVGGTSLQQLHAGNPRSVLGISARAGMTVASVATLASGIGKIAGAHDWFSLALGTTGVASGVLGAAYAGASFVIVSRRVNADKRSRVVRVFDSAGDFASVALGGLSTVSQWKQGEVDLAVATATSTALLLAGRLNTHFPNATPLVKKIPTAIVMIPVAAFGYKFIIGVAPLVGGLFNWIFGGGGPSQSNLAPGALPSASPSASPSTSPSAAPSATSSPAAITSPSSQPQPSQGTPSSPPSPSNSPQPYIVVAGDSLWVIADQHRQSLLDAAHVSRAEQQAMTQGEQDARALSEILQLNPSVAADPGRLAIGTPLNVG
ncbi:peptidoglycan-binding protein [Burkholderia lata]|uniref:LWXIA domain-containing protein n=1 Tax=Burkholderia lata (strain ATCC 17760 / DSM 23089 / LMG 22485 / NCIMB 9086 / R18194 / 383) TaxID=482957 RepID=UPI0014538A53|nr:LWXIA domain-containing protein [Burkholderia lata]VWC74101.1 peptidoglycan-binding protein [Burkholderia lata]